MCLFSIQSLNSKDLTEAAAPSYLMTADVQFTIKRDNLIKAYDELLKCSPH